MTWLYHHIIHHDLGKTYYKWVCISEKIKTINNKIVQNKVHYNIDRQTGKISALSSGNNGKDVLPVKDLLEKAATMKRLEYSMLGK